MHRIMEIYCYFRFIVFCYFLVSVDDGSMGEAMIDVEVDPHDSQMMSRELSDDEGDGAGRGKT